MYPWVYFIFKKCYMKFDKRYATGFMCLHNQDSLWNLLWNAAAGITEFMTEGWATNPTIPIPYTVGYQSLICLDTIQLPNQSTADNHPLLLDDCQGKLQVNTRSHSSTGKQAHSFLPLWSDLALLTLEICEWGDRVRVGRGPHDDTPTGIYSQCAYTSVCMSAYVQVCDCICVCVCVFIMSVCVCVWLSRS